MSTPWYVPSGVPGTNAQGSSQTMRQEFDKIETALDKLPSFSGNANKVVVVNAGETALEATSTLTGITLQSSPVLVTPHIPDLAADDEYIITPSELAADRTITLPALAANDEFTFNAHTQTLTNKTLTSPAVTGLTGSVSAITGSAASGFTIGNLTLADGSITDSSGTIDFGDENLTTSGNVTLSAGVLTVGSTTDGAHASVSGSVSALGLGSQGAGARALFEYNRTAGALTYKEGTYGAEGSALITVSNAGAVTLADDLTLSDGNLTLSSGILTVTAPGSVDTVAAFISQDANAYIRIEDSATTTGVTSVGIGAVGDDLLLRAGNANHLRLYSTGDIIHSGGDLTLSAGDLTLSAGYMRVSRSAAPGVIFTDTANSVSYEMVAGTDKGILRTTTNHAMHIRTNSTDGIVISTAQDVTIPTGDLTVSAGDIVIGTEGAGLIRSVNTSYTRISGGSSVSSGANMLLQGGNAGVTSGDMTFRADGTAWFFYDHSATQLSVKNTSDFIVEAGDLTVSAGSVTAGTEIKSQGGSASVSAGEGTLSGNATSGAVVQGSGSGYDISIQNKSSSVAMRVPTGTTNVQLPSGDLAVMAGDLKVSAGFLNFGTRQSVTCDTNGDIAVTGSRYKVIPFGGAGIGADTLNHATGGSDGDMLILVANDGAADPITVAHATAGAGGFYFYDSTARVLNSSTDQVVFIHDGTNWVYMEAGT